MARFIVAYDIANPGRLRRVARYWENLGDRVQKSVFLVVGSKQELAAWMGGVESIIDLEADSVMAWQVSSPDSQLSLGEPPILEGGSLVFSDDIEVL